MSRIIRSLVSAWARGCSQAAASGLRYVFRRHLQAGTGTVLVFTDTLPINKRREAVEKSIKTVCRHELQAETRFESYHHPSASNPWLQVADCCAWAVFRKWEQGDARSGRPPARAPWHVVGLLTLPPLQSSAEDSARPVDFGLMGGRSRRRTPPGPPSRRAGAHGKPHCFPNPIPLTQITAMAVRSNFSLTMVSLRRSNRMAPPAL